MTYMEFFEHNASIQQAHFLVLITTHNEEWYSPSDTGTFAYWRDEFLPNRNPDLN